MKFDRRKEDVGNILALEHVNITLPDQALGCYFFVNVLGLTRDPYMDFGPVNAWINVGNQQFHLPTGTAQVLRGHVGINMPNLESLIKRLHRARERLANTQFAFTVGKHQISVICPWGNKIKCFRGNNAVPLGIRYVELSVDGNNIEAIARFYQQILRSPVKLTRNACEVLIGRHQTLRYKASKLRRAYDGHHISIYVSDFSTPYDALKERKLITEESDQHQYRFSQIVDPDTNQCVFELEHEIRSLHHPMFARHLVNRNVDQHFLNYASGKDAFYPN